MSKPTIKNFFPGYIGQSAIIGEFNEILSLEEKGVLEPLRPRFFSGPAGTGKTEFAKMVAAARATIHGGEHEFIVIAPGTTRPMLIKRLAEHAAGKPATIFVDECHDSDKRFNNALKPILETGGKIEDVRLSDECIFPANPFQHLWLFASNEDCASKDPALFGPSGRTSKMQFVPYTHEEKKRLITLAVCEHEASVVKSIHADALEFLAGRVWPNARAIMQEMGPELRRKANVHGADKLTLQFAKDFCAGNLAHLDASLRHTIARYPMGLLWTDIQILRYVAPEVKGKQVQDIAAFTQEAKKDLAYRLSWLHGLGLMQTLANGRKALAQGGADYLRAMDDAIKRAQAAKAGAATKAAKAEEKKEEEKPAKPATDEKPKGKGKEKGGGKAD